jgi:hypothetical protein
MGKNFINENSFQLLRTNPLLTSNLQIVVDSNYTLYLETINSHEMLNNDIYKHFMMTKTSFLEDKIPEFYNNLPINIAFYVKNDDDKDVVYKDFNYQYDTLYWSGVQKTIENEFYQEEYEYFAPLYIYPHDMPDSFIILRVDDPAIYIDEEISTTTRDNFRNEIIKKWKCVNFFDMTTNTDFGYWLEKNYINNNLFPKAPLEINFKQYEYTKWFGIDYSTGVYTNKSIQMEDKLWYENPHFNLEQFITEGYKNSELIFPNIANLKFLFDDTPSSPFEYKSYTLNRYYGFYCDFEHIKTLTPYRSQSLIPNLKIQDNIFMSIDQVSGSTCPFATWSDTEIYYIFAKNKLQRVDKILNNNTYYYKIISEYDLVIGDINRYNEIDIIFSGDTNDNYTNEIIPRTQTNFNFNIDITYNEIGMNEMYGDLYLIKIDNKYHIIESIKTILGDYRYYIRTDYAISCDDSNLKYWNQIATGENLNSVIVHDSINEDEPLSFDIYRLSFRDVKDFDFKRVNTDYADYDFNNTPEYCNTPEEKLHTSEFRDSSLNKTYKYFDGYDINRNKIINVSSEYISTDELFEITKNGLTKIWDKNQNIVKWGYKQSISHSNYPYKFNNSELVGKTFNRTSDTFTTKPNIANKTHEYFYRIGNFFNSNDNSLGYYNNQTLSIETEHPYYNSRYFDLSEYMNNDFDYFDYFFKNVRFINESEDYEETCNYSIFNHGDNYLPSNTLFKGIKFNAHNPSDIVKDGISIIKIITDKKITYNNYKFSIILNDMYNNIQTNVIGYPLDEGIHIFVNDKYKNILVIITIDFIDTGSTQLNDLSVMDPYFGIYMNQTLSGTTAYSNYDPNLITASNFVTAINNINSAVMKDYIKIYDVDNNTFFKLDDVDSSKTPKIILEALTPDNMKLKKDSYTSAAIKGPKFNIYNKFKTDYNELIYDKSFIKEPLARIITKNDAEIQNQPIIRTDNKYTKSIYRFCGQYEPIFKNIELFAPTKYKRVSSPFTQSKCGIRVINVPTELDYTNVCTLILDEYSGETCFNYECDVDIFTTGVTVDWGTDQVTLSADTTAIGNLEWTWEDVYGNVVSTQQYPIIDTTTFVAGTYEYFVKLLVDGLCFASNQADIKIIKWL